MAIDLTGLMPQQRQIVTTLDRPLFVSAGAGSGKTFTLTRRIIWALSRESGPFVQGLDQVLAITFTKDAAAEIRERVRAALIAEGMDEQALTVDDAWISTIHGMCARILRAHALELGIDPEFTVIEDTDELMEHAIDHVLAAAGVDPDAEGASAGALRGAAAGRFQHLFQWYPIMGEIGPDGSEAGTSVHKVVRRLLERACSLPGGMDDIHLVRGAIELGGMADACRAIIADFPRQKAADGARAILDAIDAFEAGERTYDDVMRLIAACKLPRAQGKAKDAVLLLAAEASDALVNATLSAGAPALDELMALAREVEGEFTRLKAEQSALDNNDLLRLAYEALRDHPALRELYAHKFKMVMVDEFQDTDQQQVDLISYLTGAGDRALCTVGDAQQSIYRFRGAEVEVFRRKERVIARTACGAAPDGASASEDAPAGEIVKLVRNFRSHADILAYVSQVFDGAEGGLMAGFLDLEAHDGRKDGLVARDASRRQAIFVAGGNAEARAQAKAAAIARRFRELAQAGQPVGDMVVLLGKMSRAGIYADALRAAGLECVISGGSVFSSTVEAQSMRALVCTLANPADTASGLVPLLASPMFALGVEEFLALATAFDPETGETRRRNVDVGIMSDEDAPGLAGLPLVARAREVLRDALARVGRDSIAQIARDVVNGSGWMVRLAARGPEGRAQAANVLKALGAIAEAEAELGRSPRRIALAFDRFLAGKEAPGALNEQDGGAVRIMTVHASKGLEFPVVAVAECFAIRSNTDRVQMHDTGAGAEVVALPALLSGARLPDGSFATGEALLRALDKLREKLTPDMVDDVCASTSAAGAFMRMRAEDDELELQEQARLLYVAMTRAREVLILAMDNAAGTSRSKPRKIAFNPALDLTGDVLGRILPAAAASLDCDRLAFEDSRPGDFELILLDDVAYGDELLAARGGEAAEEEAGAPADEHAPAPQDAPALDSFTLARPATVSWHVMPAAAPARDSYSYTSMARALHDAADTVALEDRHERDRSDEALAPTPQGDPTALGSAFHAAAQWLIETASDTVPAPRRAALARFWGLTETQVARLDEALARWEGSRVRAEMRSWPCVRAEVPFFSCGMEAVRDEFGAFAEGAIDVLCTDPARPHAALVLDYKTGGSAAETDDELRKKHELQARVYADVLHKAGFTHVELVFVRVEIACAHEPAEPQTVRYVLDATLCGDAGGAPCPAGAGGE